MFDQETAQFFQLLRSNTIGESSSIGLRSVLESNIPANVKTFFRADVEWLRAQEKKREVRSSKFSFSIPEVRLLDEQIDLLLVNNYTFTRKDFEATADKCIHFLLNYLCRPQWTLSSFFFDATIRITADEMLSKLRYCADYSYYRAVLAKYAESRQRTDVGSEEMKRLLKTIDDEICGQASPQVLANIAKPMFEFVGAIRASMQPPLSARVPLRALIYFFEDKKLTRYSDALGAIRDKNNGIEFTLPMLEMVLEAAFSGTPLPDAAALAAASPQEPEEVKATAAPHTTFHPGQEIESESNDTVEPAVTAADDEAEHAPETTPQTAETSGGADDEEMQKMMYQRQASIVENPDEFPEPPADTEPQGEEESAEADSTSGGPMIVSPPYFSDGDKQTIISTLFRGDEAMFDEAINTAANTQTWDEAIIMLDHFFAEQGIDPFSKEAMMFANILESWHRTLSAGETR